MNLYNKYIWCHTCKKLAYFENDMIVHDPRDPYCSHTNPTDEELQGLTPKFDFEKLINCV